MEPVTNALDLALSGQFAHPAPLLALEGLPADSAGVRLEGLPRTIHEIVGHLVYWQDVTLDWIDGTVPELPSDPEEPWPVGPKAESEDAWRALVAHFLEGVERARRIAAEGDLTASLPGMEGATALGSLHVMASHNSYHVGQILLIRRMLGLWG